MNNPGASLQKRKIRFFLLILSISASGYSQEFTLRQKILARNTVKNYTELITSFAAGSTSDRFLIEDLFEEKANQVCDDVHGGKTMELNGYLSMLQLNKTSIKLQCELDVRDENITWFTASRTDPATGRNRDFTYFLFTIKKTVNGKTLTEYVVVGESSLKIVNVLDKLPSSVNIKRESTKVEIPVNSAEYWFDKGESDYNAKRYQEAKENFSKALQKDPDFENALEGHGWCEFYLGDFTSAEKDFKKLRKVNPNSKKAYYGLAFIAGSKLDYGSAINYMNNALMIYPEYAEEYVNRGALKHWMNDIDGEVKDYRKAIEIDPKNYIGFYRLGDIEYNRKEYNEAIANYKKAIENDPTHTNSYGHLGKSLVQMKDYQSAITYLDKAIRLKNDFSNAYYERGLAKHELGDESGFCNDLKKAAELGHEKAISDLGKYCK